MPAPPLPSTSPPISITLQYNSDFLTLSDAPDLLSSVPSNPVLDSMLPTEPHLLITVTATSLEQTSPPDLGAAAENDASPKPDLHKMLLTARRITRSMRTL
ncbi:hypothetical protein EDB87DRAFT_1686548 [Lactarius vividus]|nr:hypothetical protein EDB87DRAFT_1686548 [Lactarius vividus]